MRDYWLTRYLLAGVGWGYLIIVIVRVHNHALRQLPLLVDALDGVPARQGPAQDGKRALNLEVHPPPARGATAAPDS